MNASPDMIPAPMANAKPAPDPLAPDAPVRVDPLDCPAWDALVAAHPQASFFHTTAWARVLRDSYGHVPMAFCRIHDGRLQDSLPVMEISSRWTGRRGVALPFTDLCPPLTAPGQSAGPLFGAAMGHGRNRGWKYLECRGGAHQWHSASPSLAFHGHVLDLVPDEKTLSDRLEPAVRRGIRKAEQSGLQVRFDSDAESVRTFYALHCRTRRRHGLPPQPPRFFRNIARHVLLPGHGWVVSASLDRRTIAAALFFHHGRRAIYKFGASDYAMQSLRPNNLLMWRAIRHYAAHGFHSLNLGRTSLSNEGLRRFKLGFGAREEHIEYARFSYVSRKFVADTDRVAGWYNPVFRCLPLPLLRWAGLILYPHLS